MYIPVLGSTVCVCIFVFMFPVMLLCSVVGKKDKNLDFILNNMYICLGPKHEFSLKDNMYIPVLGSIRVHVSSDVM